MPLFSREGIAVLDRRLKHSPVLGAAYVTKATEVAAKALLGVDKIYPSVDILKNDAVPIDIRADVAFVHSLFNTFQDDVPEVLNRYGNLRQVLELLWIAHVAVHRALTVFPGLIEASKAFLDLTVVPVLNQDSNQVFTALKTWVKDAYSPFYQDDDTFLNALVELLDKLLGMQLPEDPAQSNTVQASSDVSSGPTINKGNSPSPQEQTIRTENNPIENALSAISAYVEGIRLTEQISVNIRLPRAGQESRELIDRVLDYNTDIYANINNKGEFVYYEVPTTERARKQYAAIAEALEPQIRQIRKSLEEVLRVEHQLELANTGRVHPHLVSRVPLGVSPFVKVQPEEDQALHMVFLLDESGSMTSYIYLPLHIDTTSTNSERAYMGYPTGVTNSRYTLAKLVAIMFYEALKTSNTKMEFYGYGGSVLPEKIYPSRRRMDWVRKLADNANPYPLASTFAFNDNSDLSALSLAYHRLKYSNAKHKLVVYLADGYVSDDGLTDTINQMVNMGIHVIWLDMSGTDLHYRTSGLSAARRFAVNSYQDAVKVLPAFLSEVMSW